MARCRELVRREGEAREEREKEQLLQQALDVRLGCDSVDSASNSSSTSLMQPNNSLFFRANTAVIFALSVAMITFLRSFLRSLMLCCVAASTL